MEAVPKSAKSFRCLLVVVVVPMLHLLMHGPISARASCDPHQAATTVIQCDRNVTTACDLLFTGSKSSGRGLRPSRADMRTMFMDGYVFMTGYWDTNFRLPSKSITRCEHRRPETCERYASFAKGDYTMHMAPNEPRDGKFWTHGTDTTLLCESKGVDHCTDKYKTVYTGEITHDFLSSVGEDGSGATFGYVSNDRHHDLHKYYGLQSQVTKNG